KRPRSDSPGTPSVPLVPAKNVSNVVEEVEKPPLEILTQLLNMSHVPSSTEPSHFLTLATMLMQSFHLCVANTDTPPVVSSYELLEVEFYWYCEETGHVDPFTHAAEEQRVAGNWYFHRAPRRIPLTGDSSTKPLPSPKTSGFRGGTRKGLDLTFGVPPPTTSPSTSTNLTISDASPSDGIKPLIGEVGYGGILLRALRNTSTQKVTAGPSLLVDEVLRAAGSSELPHLVGTLWAGDTCALGEEGPGRMFLRPVPTSSANTGKKKEPAAIYTSPRIGLDLSRIQTASTATATHPRVQYLIRPYRFFQHPALLGSARPQTVYGLLASGLPRSKVSGLVGAKPIAVETMDGHLQDGRRKGKAGIAEFISENGKGAAPSSTRFMKMAGVVESILNEGKDGGKIDSGEGGSGKDEGGGKRQKLGKTLTEMFAPKSKSKPEPTGA
ncbi:hypothetical protein BDV93DRAFT_528252, partial [Ceratobasidium sp. AG-I]